MSAFRTRSCTLRAQTGLVRPNAEGKKATSKPRTRKRFPSLHEMPFDIFLEILLQIDPKGLINLARTNTDTRKALVNATMEKTLWKRVRVESEANEPPPGWSEAKWVAFLFVTSCYSCGKANAPVDFYILKRLCDPCKKRGLKSQSMVQKDIWWAPRELSILDSRLGHNYVLYTRYPQSMRGGPQATEYYWRDDVDRTLAEWKALCVEHGGGEPINTVKELLEFKEEREAYVRDIQLMAPKMVKWDERLQKQRMEDLKLKKELLVASIQERFIDLGIYKREDIGTAINRKSVGSSAATEVTDGTWKRWRTKLEPCVVEAQNARVREIRRRRMSKVLDQWGSWVASQPLPAFERLAYPDPRDIWHLSQVTSIREADAETEPEESAYQAIFNDFSTIASSFVADKRTQLQELVPDCGRRAKGLYPLELATSVFTAPKEMTAGPCGSGTFAIRNSAVVGWKSLSVCQCTEPAPETADDMPAVGERTILPEFNSLLSEVARSLVQLCGLDPAEATIEDMDCADERFVCCACEKTLLRHVDNPANELIVTDAHASGAITLAIYSWKNALNHARYDRSNDEMWARDPCDLKIPTFRKLSDLRVTSIRDVVDAHGQTDRENAMGLHLLGEWSCNRCLKRLGVGRDEIFEHLINAHDVPDPVLGEDYFTNPFRPNFCCRLSLKVRKT